MRRDEKLRARTHNIVRYAHGKRRAFAGIRTRTQLVEQHKRMLRDLAEYLYDVPYMRGECRKALFDALFVADVAVHAVEHGHFSALCRHIHSGQRHAHEKSRHLERHGLSAGVRTRDEQHLFLRLHSECKRDNLFSVDQRMPSLFDGQLSLRTEFGAHRLHLVRKLCAREDRVHLHYHGVTRLQSVAVRADGDREIAQYALYLRLFVELLRLELVVELHYLHGLDVQRRSGRGLIVHKTAYRSLELALYGNDVSVAAHRDYAVLQIFVVGRRCDEQLKSGLDVVAEFPYAHAYRAQFGRGVVRHLGFGDEGVEDVFLQLFVGIKSRDHAVKSGYAGDCGHGFPEPPCHAQRPAHAEYLRDGQHRALLRFEESFLYVVHGKRGRYGELEKSPVRLRGHVESQLRLRAHADGTEPVACGFAALGLCAGGKHFENFPVFERVKTFVVKHIFSVAFPRTETDVPHGHAA